MKTPNEIAHEQVEKYASIHAERLTGHHAAMIAAKAIEADRAQHERLKTQPGFIVGGVHKVQSFASAQALAQTIFETTGVIVSIETESVT